MTARPPYQPGDHAHGFYYDRGTCSGPVTIVRVERAEMGLPPWRVEYRVNAHPEQAPRTAYVGHDGEGDYLLPPAVAEKCRRSNPNMTGTPPCPGCVAAGAVDPDGPVYSLAEQVAAAAGIL